MKILAHAAMVALLFLSAVTCFSQNARPAATQLFSKYPTAINCKEDELNTLFNNSAGKNINVSFSGASLFSGVVTSNITRRNNLQYIAIKLAGLDDAVLSVSKRIEQNKTFYIGHIINPKNADAYELKQTTEGSYQFIKTDLDKIMPTCSQQVK